jgi:thioredoxin 1
MAIEITDGNITGILNNNSIVLIDFFALWCGPCKMLGPVIEEIYNDNQDIVVGKLNVDNNSSSANKYGIRSIPSLLFFKNGEIVERAVGFKNKNELQSIIDKIK